MLLTVCVPLKTKNYYLCILKTANNINYSYYNLLFKFNRFTVNVYGFRLFAVHLRM